MDAKPGQFKTVEKKKKKKKKETGDNKNVVPTKNAMNLNSYGLQRNQTQQC